MGWSLWLSSLVWLLLNSLLFNALVFANSFNTSSVQSLSCHDDERSALLQFKQSFVIDRSVSVYEESLHLTSVYIPSTVPDFLANFTSLKSLVFQNCGLYGEFPLKIFHLPNLQVLYLGWNKDLTGYLPEFHQRSPLEQLVLSETSFSGSIPSSIEKLESLQILYLLGCKFSGPLPSSLSKLTQLTNLGLIGNHLGGPIPSWLGNLSRLSVLWLDDNSLSGSIPSSFQNLSQLSYLSLRDNHITGPIPTWIGNLTQLTELYLYGNELYGSIPYSLSQLKNLQRLVLNENNLSGTVEFDMFFTMTSLFDLHLTEQVTNGTGIYRSWSVHYRYSTTIVNKGLERYYAVIQENFAEIDLSSNKFNGEIPQFIGNLKALRSLNLSFNNLMGCIPSSLGNLMELESLDLSHNNLSGEIPQQLTGLTFLQNFDVSHNNLTGLIPQGNQFGTFENTSFEGNPYLCGIPLSKKCSGSKALPAVEEEDDSGSLIELDWKFILAGGISGFVVGVALGDMVIPKRHGWFLKAFRRIPPRMEIRQRRD
ncbi:hypothetical protein TIFTF001_037260 [Ficus carica]|uniref:Receptor-like protein 12 n=1 Tax=Ficus carica TaxID=3494 RepID=A0AA88E5R6_FICCA|nr:hypothetical protein TIFTF001_037260 [Ficus carica]